ncbi:uncharacterized protein PV09_08106 [Verruconis gallopava]|uniref:Mediator of RNA polymerase II transcription subunit 9 n=1 Tax=Verruconis gallopava TaxID=253628 RepID=A0A0D1YHQ7_9PEZI|nr:uncharacterized protein PV09_08106 [Verruconis gallopava]KIW00397.1 hypothetical protein PV09_08106 [Verruconis gallopava]
MATPRAPTSVPLQGSAGGIKANQVIVPTTKLSTPTLPPPDTFDFLPPLYGLLRRLQQPSGIEAPVGAQDGNSAALPEGSPSQQLERTVSGGSGKLELSHLDAAASAIRLKIQKARQLVANMPDIERTVEEQEEELAELESRVTRQRAMLAKLGVNLEASTSASDIT